MRTATSIALVLVFAVITASAYLRLEQAGLGCANWPACYGARLTAPGAAVMRTVAKPSMVVVSVRITHRVAAAGIGFLVIVITVSCLRSRRRWPEGAIIAVVLVALTFFLAILGRSTQGSRLPAVTLGNLLGGMAMLALLWWLYLQISDRNRPYCSTRDPSLIFWSWIGLAALVLQISLGAMVSAGYAAASCTTVPDCHGIWWSADWPLSALNAWREVNLVVGGSWQSDPVRQALHMAHRLGALTAVGCLTGLALLLMRRGGARLVLGLRLLGLLLLQVALGAAAVYFQPALLLVLAHNGVSALLVLVVVSAIHYSRSAEVANVSTACHMATSK